MNRYPVWKYALLVIALRRRHRLHAAEFLRRGAGGAGLERQGHGQGRRLARAARRGHPRQGRPEARLRPVRRQFGQGALRRPRRPAQGQGRARRRAQPRPEDPTYIVALNLLSRSPQLADRAACPADVPRPRPARRRPLPDAGRHEGGADQEGRCLAGDARTLLRDKNIRHAGITRDGNAIVVRFRDAQTQAAAQERAAATSCPTSLWLDSADGSDFKLAGNLKPDAAKRCSRRRSRRTSPPCTTGSTSSAWPSR